MYKMLFGMMAGITLALVGTLVFQEEKPPPQSTLSLSQAPDYTRLEQSLIQIAKELALLQASVDGLGTQLSVIPASARYAPVDEVSSPAAVPPEEMMDVQDANSMDPQALALQKQDVLNQLLDSGITLPDFMASAQLTELPPEAQEEIMQELVRRFNNGEIDRERFISGYKY